MHTLQPKHSKLKPEEVKNLIEKYNISVTQLPRIKATDASLPEDSLPGEVIRIERKSGEKINVYYRVIV